MTITYSIAPGATLDIYPISSIIPASPAGMQEMEVLLTSVPGVSHGTLYRVQGTSYYPWGSGAPNEFTVGAGNDRIYAGEGFEYVNNGTGDGTSETIPVNFRDTTGFTDLSDTIVININSHLNPPTITTQPNTFIQIPPGGKATMSVVGAGTPAPTYQWYSGIEPDTSNPIAGATSTSYTTPALTTIEQYYYWVQVSNGDGTANSLTVTVQVAQPTTVTTSNVSTTFNTAAQSVNVSATVSPAESSGNVTFSILALGETARSGTVTNGQTGNTAFPIPAGAAAGTYTLNAEYDAPAGIASSTDSKTLTINQATTSVADTSSPVISDSTSAQNLTLSAKVSSPAGPVNEGTVTFTLMSGSTVIGSPVTSGNVSTGTASATYSVPASVTAGAYTVKTTYDPGSDYVGSTDTAHYVFVAPVVNSDTAVITTTTPTLVITGVGFSNTASADVVALSTGAGTVTSASATSLTFTFSSLPAAGTLQASVTVNGQNSGQVTAATVQPLPVWMASGGTATWNQVTQSLVVTGAATMIGNPLATGDHPVVTIASGGNLAVTPSLVQQVTVGGLNVASGGLARLTATTGTPTVLTVVAGGTFNVAGKLDLADNGLDVAGGSLSSVQALVTTGANFFSGSPFNGTAGITSSTAAANMTHLTAIGVIQNNQSGTPLFSSAKPFDGIIPGASDILLKYTYFGDANLDGAVDGSDYSLIDQSYNSEKAGRGAVTTWLGGNFDYDSSVDGSDYALIDNACNNQTVRYAPTVDFSNGFTNAGSSVAVNGNTSVVGSTLQLTSGTPSVNGSAYYATPLTVAKFHTTFTFDIGAGAGTGDGFTFVIQNNSTSAVGILGGGLGYEGISNSVAIKFDLYNNNGEGSDSTGLYSGGAVPFDVGSIDLSSSGIDLHAGHPIQASVSYNGSSMTVQLYDTVTGASASQNYVVNIASLVGGPTAYFGFTAGSGEAAAQQSISNWVVYNQ